MANSGQGYGFQAHQKNSQNPDLIQGYPRRNYGDHYPSRFHHYQHHQNQQPQYFLKSRAQQVSNHLPHISAADNHQEEREERILTQDIGSRT
eukprot:TRINITY_DN26093_c0_g1_i2.p1 TRINITY_DN26093_c0_g1~~TRINITY_DN26093_c0_g1_i2.p1  ORF type:complete len:108 (+),score=10.93 TRINITY_DN26093_c0_g1_i2:49-324(+)